MLQSKKRMLPRCLLLAATYLFLLLLSYGFPVTGDDWWFTTRHQDESLLEALEKGFHTAVNHFYTTNGRYLGNFLSGAMGCSKLLRELTRCGILFGTLLAMCRVCRLRGVGVLFALALLIALPAPIYAQTYAWAAGFFNYVPPALLLLLYFSAVQTEFTEPERRAAPACVPLFLLGMCTQFFVENVTVSVCLLSGALVLLFALRRKRLSPRLFCHWIGTLLGAVLMFLAQGYRNVGSEGYREVPSGLRAMVRNAGQNFMQMTGELMENNWLLIGLLTLTGVWLLLRLADRRKYLAFTILVPATFFWADMRFLRPMSYNHHILRLSLLLNAVFTLFYVAGLALAIRHGISDCGTKRRAFLFLSAALLALTPLLAVSPIGPRCFYLPQVLLVCLTLSLAQDIARTTPRLGQTLRLPAALCAGVILGGFLWMMAWNGHVEAIRTGYTELCLARGAEQITLPNYPYPDYVYGSDFPVIGQYYYRQTPYDTEFTFVPYAQWSADRKLLDKPPGF